jgi:5-methyltetrahydrofolate--homocysteine methyltransferase
MMGVSPAEMVQPLIDAGASVVGANCGNGIEGMVAIVKEIRSVNPEIPILVHANAGMPVYRDGETVFPESPGEMAANLKALIVAGANIVGGCCGTTPEHIARLRETLGTL